MNLLIDTQGLLDSLPFMAKGMIGIFLVIGIIYLTVFLLGKCFPPKA